MRHWWRAFVHCPWALCAGALSCTTTEPSPCGDEGCDSEYVPTVFVTELRETAVDKLDLLLVIDNSTGMSGKQALLGRAIPSLLDRLTMAVPGAESLEDIHVAVVTSSLGSYGTPACSSTGDPARDEQLDDRGRLLGSRPRAAGVVPEGGDFLAWSVTPEGSDVPAGAFDDLARLGDAVQSLVDVAGDRGCDYEAPLEAWYRFLSDPTPPDRFVTVPCASGSEAECIEAQGVDTVLLDQRRAFLRPDSMVVVVMFSDENDCSIQGWGQLYYAARDMSLPRATAVCNDNPNDPCCASCALDPLPGCEPDPTCTDESGRTAVVPEAEDPPSLRCFEQRRRFGVSFLYPTDRYVNALRSFELCTGRPDLASEDCDPADLEPNPLFQDLSGQGGNLRSPDLVFIAGIVGVPWQDVQATEDASGEPHPAEELHFQTAAQMVLEDTWSTILGLPRGEAAERGLGEPMPPTDPLMIESIEPRTGANPITGDALASPDAGTLANPINGHERRIADGDDLQYACIFPLPEPRPCDGAGATCPCQDGATTLDPICHDPATGRYGTTQHFDRAYPGPRFLGVLRDMGANAITASICARETSDPAAADFGYVPAMSAIVDAIEPQFRAECLPYELLVDELARYHVFEVLLGGTWSCERPGRSAVEPGVVQGVLHALEQSEHCGGPDSPCAADEVTVCELEQVEGDCYRDAPSSQTGWCYIDPASGLGEPSLVADCPASRRRRLRFVDPSGETPAEGALLFGW